MSQENVPANQGNRHSRGVWVLLGFLAIVGFFLFSEHQAHVLGVLPFVLLALCPLLHFFHGHGGRGAEGGHRRHGPEGKA